MTLKEAIETNRLDEFAEQAEARLVEFGHEHPDVEDVEAALAAPVRSLQSEDQT